MNEKRRYWFHELSRYHWYVLVVAALGWLFDTMDQQLFNIARVPAMRELLQTDPNVPAAKELVTKYSTYATSIFLIGWATGGIGFGILGDLIGRAKTMVLTILAYSLFTGLSAFSVGFWDFAAYRFLTGLGVGGEFAVGVSLVAEVMPEKARPFALGLLQALSAVGNILAGLIGLTMAFLGRAEIISGTSSWRYMFVVGTLPALLAVFIRGRLKEPERWQAVATADSFKIRVGAYFTELFASGRWAKNAVIGLILASSGVIGLWSIGFFSIDLQRSVFRSQFEAQGMAPKDVTFYVDVWASVTSIMLNIGAGFGIYGFSILSHYIGRKWTFALAFLMAMISTILVFLFFDGVSDIFWLIPFMGFCQLSLFGGYAIYFPELFPTRLRSTGTSFCYNVGRFLAAGGPYVLGLLTTKVYHEQPEPLRYAGVTMCAVFLVGLAVLPFAPETRGRPLPE